MGRFVNPECCSAFQCAVNSEVYVDKTGLLEYTNRVLATNAGLSVTAVRADSENLYAVDMLAAYYSKGCDSEKMFSGPGNQQRCPDFYEHFNKYDVIHFDIQWFLANCDEPENLVAFITEISAGSN